MNAMTASAPTLEQPLFTISGYGRTYRLTEDEFNAAMHAADAVAGASHPLTTGEAAEILGVSAKTVARLLDAGEMPFYRNGTAGHRMVELRDVIAYKSKRERRHNLMEQARGLAYRMGGYDIPDETANGTAK
ncbi:helix-turn-helix domain-containing protein [Bifidobacterium simiarum]|uniref:Excisionase n=1 Tax=Bifidobacterium simiarum TaxID=2045441 RepID=A0A2M9HF94_9BIFI|nr:helix-turn-helix domain-containing protein [Bifidobacterium simiarum]PJM75484.1 excisionase [Bifidobacterium simiarum]